MQEAGSAGHARASVNTVPDTTTAGVSRSSAGEQGMHPSSTFTLTSSEYGELVEDLVTDSPKVSLADLEARLEIIKPEDLEVRKRFRDVSTPAVHNNIVLGFSKQQELACMHYAVDLYPVTSSIHPPSLSTHNLPVCACVVCPAADPSARHWWFW